MSKYTTEVRFICEKYAGKDVSVDYSKVDNVISAARPYIFDFDYPIFSAAYKPGLESKILKHFYTREICAETVGLWKLFLNRKMNEIMPYYNQLYNSELITFDPLQNTNITVTRDDEFKGNQTDANTRKTTNSGRDIDTTTVDRDETIQKRGYDNVAFDDRDEASEKITYKDKSGSNDSSTAWHYEADTPQSTIAGVDDTNYATRASKDTATNNYHKDNETKTALDRHNDTRTTYNNDETIAEDTTTVDTLQYGKITDDLENLLKSIINQDAFVEHRAGKSEGETYSEMLNKFRTTFLNIDMQIISDLEPCFFSLW